MVSVKSPFGAAVARNFVLSAIDPLSAETSCENKNKLGGSLEVKKTTGSFPILLYSNRKIVTCFDKC